MIDWSSQNWPTVTLGRNCQKAWINSVTVPSSEFKWQFNMYVPHFIRLQKSPNCYWMFCNLVYRIKCSSVCICCGCCVNWHLYEWRLYLMMITSQSAISLLSYVLVSIFQVCGTISVSKDLVGTVVHHRLSPKKID